MDLSQKLKYLRKRDHYTQETLAKTIKVERSSVGKYETGTMPSMDVLQRIAQCFNVTVDSLIDNSSALQTIASIPKPRGVKIPVLGVVTAGIPIEAIEDIIDYEEISEDMARNGEYFGLLIRGDSMTPTIQNGDIVIVRRQPDVESGETAIVMVNGDEATCKKVVKQKQGISLVANNPDYEPRFFTNEEIEEIPVRVIGKVVELRRKF